MAYYIKKNCFPPNMITDVLAKSILKTYEEAWVEQDVDKILSIFEENGIYHERVLKEPMVGHSEIAAYWQSKVCEEQSDIVFKLLNYYISGNTIIAEWEASFNSNIINARYHLKSVAVLEIKHDKIHSFREYWHSEKTPLN